MTEPQILRWRTSSNLDVIAECPRCREDFHVHARFVAARPAHRFLWLRYPATVAHWLARCGICGNEYRVDAYTGKVVKTVTV